MKEELLPDQADPASARALQDRLRSRIVLSPPDDLHIETVAGLDLSMDRGCDVGYAGISVLDARTLEPVDEVAVRAPLRFPYVPGLLSFRELPALLAAWRELRVKPDLLVFDGQGTAHPRRFGLACHGGLLFDTPSIGCAKSLLVGRHGPLGEERGARAELVHHGEVIGMAVRTRARVNPLYVSPGHRIDLQTAVEWVLRLAARFREPETTRRSHRLVNELRRADKGRP
jgi:deoxyribonuclease V